MNLPENIRAARRAGVPLLAIDTDDPASASREVIAALNGKAQELAIAQWDILRGLVAMSPPAQDAIRVLCDGQDPALATGNPAECLSLLARWPERGLVMMHGAGRLLSDDQGGAAVVQGIWNLRDVWKSTGTTLVLLSPGIQLPPELKQDVVVLTEELPTAEALGDIVIQLSEDSGIAVPDDTADKAVDTVLGLSAFAAEQSLAMSLTKDGLDLPSLWDRKCQAIEQTPGLSVWRGGETFADIGGCENAKTFLRSVLAGRQPPRAVVFIDEIEKSLAGAGGDTSGVSQSLLGTLLTYMQDKGTTGSILIGPPGAAKSAIAKATGNEAGVPTIALDFSGLKASLVGQSEQRLRSALRAIDAIAQGQALFLATCNSIGTLPPELRRRFTFGTFFFDLPNAEERQAIWNIYRTKFDLPEDDGLPEDRGWTGAEIKQCADLAWRLQVPLKKAAMYVVPVATSAAKQIEALRRDASGKYLSAATSGVYRYDQTAGVPTKRAMDLN